MSHLLHIDSSIQGDRSVSRVLTARAASAWRAAHPGGVVTYRDLGHVPPPHLDAESGLARLVPAEQHTAAQSASWRLSAELVEEVRAADAVLLGLPLYNYGPPSSVKAWVDHLIAPGLAFDPETHEGRLGGRDFVVIATRGGGYGPGAPREGWDHATAWLTHGVSLTGLEPRFIAAELTLAEVRPEMAELRPLAAQSLRAAQAEIEALWARETASV